jgi:hypothetical protein
MPNIKKNDFLLLYLHMINIVSIFFDTTISKKTHVMKWLESSLQPKGPKV